MIQTPLLIKRDSKRMQEIEGEDKKKAQEE